MSRLYNWLLLQVATLSPSSYKTLVRSGIAAVIWRTVRFQTIWTGLKFGWKDYLRGSNPHQNLGQIE
jgi:hypothetical protein